MTERIPASSAFLGGGQYWKTVCNETLLMLGVSE